MEAGTDACPICQEDMTDPIMLKTCKVLCKPFSNISRPGIGYMKNN